MRGYTRATSKRKSQSTGTIGEARAQWAFNQLGWVMDRVQPPTAVINTPNGAIVKHVGKGGIFDWMGVRKSDRQWIACEVKEVTEGDTMPCSRLSKDQREWADRKLAEVPNAMLAVMVIWVGFNYSQEVFWYKPKGSYIRNGGMAA